MSMSDKKSVLCMFRACSLYPSMSRVFPNDVTVYDNCFNVTGFFFQIDLQHIHGDEGVVIGDEHTVIPMGIDLCGYTQNNEWDIINVTARRKVKYYSCCPEPYPDITFNITIRRKTLFYTVNLILPIVSISCLTVLVFYLPSDSGEKITLSISILLTLTVFFLLLSDINPSTSLVIPLIGKYLLFTMIVVTMSIFLTVYTLSIHFRSPATHTMTPWMRRVYTEILPRVLCMERPQLKRQATETVAVPGADAEEGEGALEEEGPSVRRRRKQEVVPDVHYENLRSPAPPPPPPAARLEGESPIRYPKTLIDTFKGIAFIANHLKKDDEDKSVSLFFCYF